MPDSLFATHTAVSFKSYPLCVLVFLMLALPVNAQQDFESVMHGLLAKRPTTYKSLDSTLRRFKRDTVKLNTFIAEAETNEYPEGRSYALNQLGTVFRNRSEFKRAIALHQEALLLSESIENAELQVFSLNMLGVAYRRSDAIRTALDYNQRALEIADTVQRPSLHIKRNINVALNSIGNLYSTLGQYDLAISQFQRALQLEEELNNTLGLAINNQNIGECLMFKGDLEGALDRYRRSLALNDDINNDFGRVICQNSIAQIHLKQGEAEKALELLERIKAPATELGDKFLLSSVLINTGWALLEANRLNEAEGYMKQGLDMAVESNLPSMIIFGNQHLSDLEHAKGNDRKALEYYKEADRMDKAIINERNVRYMNDIILKYQTEKKNNQISDLAKENELVRLRLRKNQTTILVSALLIGLIGTILFIMYRQYQSNQEKRVIGLEQHMLRSQMNPHFLFNSLNSIKLYIINNDKKNAVHYLNKFSKLVRRILEGSSMKEIALAEELETVELYLNIEKIRFSDEINYDINIADGLNPELIKIPSMVLQPFLENAIWHGLSAKEGEKNIWLNITNKDDMHLLISVIDNGVGRKASERLKESRVLKRKSVGIDITKERLANFAKDFQNDFNVEILDLFDDQGMPKGTKVVLEIPMV
ncbi:tetratricopeptide repeat protein [Flagellimonas sp. DF-77]|uniref:tetratricopeptide repeat-containing sensor histidine kinase n=1 Tax=Flagellimonas algarum TaxID=3230298 RepID=UPI0033948FE7